MTDVDASDGSGDAIELALGKTRSWLPEAMRPLADDALESWWDVFWRFAEREDQQRLVTDGGQTLPDSLEELVDVAEEKDRLACETCGELVERRYLQGGECVGCRNGPETHAPRYGVTDD